MNDVCACTPGSYRFTFNFGSECTAVTPTGGIAASVCDVEGFGETADNVTDLMPVSRRNPLRLNFPKPRL